MMEMVELDAPYPPMMPDRSTYWPKDAMIVVRLFKIKLTSRLISTPSTPPINPMQELSIRNIVRMLLISQPRTFITPISRVRS